jgi:Na+-driven multidrug efflux pump
LFARGIQYDLNMLFFCVGLGIGKTMVTMTGMYYSAEDRQGLRRLFAYCMKLSVQVSLIAGIAVFLAAPWITKLYNTGAATAALSVFSIRCMVAGLMADVVSCAFLDYHRASGDGSWSISSILPTGSSCRSPWQGLWGSCSVRRAYLPQWPWESSFW